MIAAGEEQEQSNCDHGGGVTAQSFEVCEGIKEYDEEPKVPSSKGKKKKKF